MSCPTCNETDGQTWNGPMVMLIPVGPFRQRMASWLWLAGHG
jgi:hypothetical protein